MIKRCIWIKGLLRGNAMLTKKKSRIAVNSGFRSCCPSLDKNHCEIAASPPPSSDLALLCKYQQRASCLLCFSKARATLLTFIYICCQTITFLSYERLSRPACLNVVTHRFIIRPLRTELKGPICDPNVNKRVNPAADIQHAGLE